MSLKDKLPLVNICRDNFPEPPSWIVKDLPARGGETERLNSPTELKLTVNAARSKAGDINKVKIKKFGELLKAGEKPGEAAHKLHTSVQALMSKKENQDYVKAIIEGYTIPAKVEAMLIRALRAKNIIENSQEGGDKKELREWVKLAHEDTELGLKAPTTINNTFTLPADFKAFLDESIPDAEIIDAPSTEDLPALPEPKTP